MKIVYCDNEQFFLDMFREQFSDVFIGDELMMYTSVTEMINDCPIEFPPDIIFLDLDLGDDRNGVDYAQELCELYPDVRVIYITAYTDRFIHEIFLKNANVSGFLAKPVQREYLIKMLDKARKGKGSEASKVLISFRNSTIAIDENRIYYLESDRHLVNIITENGEYSVHEKLSDFSARLSSKFAAPHKSFIVNMDKVLRMDSRSLVLENNKSIPVSRSRYQDFRKEYMDYLKGKLWSEEE